MVIHSPPPQFFFLTDNQKLAQIFLGYVALCFLAWHSNWVPVLFGVGHVETSDRAVSFNSLGHSSVHYFPTHMPDIRSTPLSLVASGMKKKLAIMPVYAVGLYLHTQKMSELDVSRSLSSLNTPYASTSREPAIYLAFKLTFAKYETTESIVNEFAKELAGMGGQTEYKRSLELFKDILTRQISANISTDVGPAAGGMQKGEQMEFFFQGAKMLGVSIKGQKAEYIENTDLRARLINVYAGETSGWCKELVEILHTTYLSTS